MRWFVVWLAVVVGFVGVGCSSPDPRAVALLNEDDDLFAAPKQVPGLTISVVHSDGVVSVTSDIAVIYPYSRWLAAKMTVRDADVADYKAGGK